VVGRCAVPDCDPGRVADSLRVEVLAQVFDTVGHLGNRKRGLNPLVGRAVVVTVAGRPWAAGHKLLSVANFTGCSKGQGGIESMSR
jgi:hypothetical protein